VSVVRQHFLAAVLGRGAVLPRECGRQTFWVRRAKMKTGPLAKADFNETLQTADSINQFDSFQRGRLQHLAGRVRSRAAKVPSSG
jgi:hypothetical protein